jgi:hypothetical protein
MQTTINIQVIARIKSSYLELQTDISLIKYLEPMQNTNVDFLFLIEEFFDAYKREEKMKILFH